MEAVTVFKKNYRVDLRDVDFQKQLKLSTLFSYFQDGASLASDNLGFGIQTLEQKFGVAWILMRIRVDISRIPMWDEEITIETWPLQPKKLEFARDFLVRDQEGNVMVRAVSTWVIMDLQQRKLKRTSFINFTSPEVITERAINCQLGKLKHSGSLEVSYKKVIGYSDIDFNGHLNNSKYVDFIMDCFDLKEHEQYGVDTLEVDFTNEAIAGESVVLYSGADSDSNQVNIEGVKEQHQRVVCKAKVQTDARRQ